MGSIEALITNEDLRKYPFLPEALKRLKELDLTIDDLASEDIGKSILNRVRDNLVSSIRTGNVSPPHEDAEIETLSFLVTLLVLRVIGERGLAERYAVALSKRVRNFLKEENLSKVVYIAQAVIGLGVRIKGGDIYIDVVSFLNNMPEYKGAWKLVNRELIKGWVRVTFRELIRLVENGVKNLIIHRSSQEITGLELPDEVYLIVEEISTEWSKKLREYEEARSAIVKRGEAYYPPCISFLLSQMREGKNLTHSARFAVATFLLNTGMSVDETLEMFKLSPDYREDLARYQVEHIAGLRGSKVKYLTYKCDNMRSLGLCRWTCKGVRHPLQFFYRSLRGKRPDVSENS
ncbi:MAG: hypothetical protein DRJ41_03415 [Thermoprotei archaeon]|nr:MAG: hypothetical protein DRJ41_03415 [Thermoprotei archaeon]